MVMFGSIVVGTDGSHTAGKAAAQALELARATGATLQVVSAYVPVPNGRLRIESQGAPEAHQWRYNPQEDVDDVLGVVADAARKAGVDVRTHACRGDAADAILDVAEQQRAGLIVVGSKGMTGAKRFLLGSVPNKISHHAPCSVLIVRTD
jgi:nucleotide-binding universal stress UspA family protein